jgi:hypothetical protein
VFISDLKDLVISVIAYCMATYVIAAVAQILCPEKLTDKYITAWKNFGIDINDISAL